MTILFWLIILVLIAIAIYAVLPTLLNHSDISDCDIDRLNASIYQQKLLDLDQAHEDGFLDSESLTAAKEELARSLLNDTQEESGQAHQNKHEPKTSFKPVVVIAAFIPLLAISLYLYKGRHLAIDPTLYPRQSNNGSKMSMEAVIAQLEKKLNVGDADAGTWLMLGRAYLESNQWQKAEQAFASAYKLEPNQVDIILDYAEILVRINNNTFSEKSIKLVKQASRLQPRSRRTRWLLSVVDMQQGDTTNAITTWQQLLAEGTDNPEEQQMLEMLILRNGGSTDTSGSNLASDDSPSIQVKVSLAPEMINQVSKTDSVFIFARAAQGPKMPLAVAKKRADQLPITVPLSDAQAMTPAMKLSNFDSIIIGARISKTGNAIPASGDLQSLSPPLNWKEQDLIELTISDIVP